MHCSNDGWTVVGGNNVVSQDATVGEDRTGKPRKPAREQPWGARDCKFVSKGLKKYETVNFRPDSTGGASDKATEKLGGQLKIVMQGGGGPGSGHHVGGGKKQVGPCVRGGKNDPGVR